MTDFLVKMLIPDYGNTEDGAVRTRYGMLAGVVGIFCNLLLFAAKLSVGMMIGSISVMADGFNNLSDSASSLVGFVGMKMAGSLRMKIIPSVMAGLSIYLPSWWLSW